MGEWSYWPLLFGPIGILSYLNGKADQDKGVSWSTWIIIIIAIIGGLLIFKYVTQGRIAKALTATAASKVGGL